MCPQKQCLSGKADGLSGCTYQRLPPGGSSRRSRVRESALQYNQYKSKVARAPSVTLRAPPSSRRKAMLPPDSTPKRCNTLYLVSKACEKEYEQIVRTPFLFRQVLLLRVILSVVRPRSCSADASHCYAVRLRYASLRMTRADAVETRRATAFGGRISREVEVANF